MVQENEILDFLKINSNKEFYICEIMNKVYPKIYYSPDWKFVKKQNQRTYNFLRKNATIGIVEQLSVGFKWKYKS